MSKIYFGHPIHLYGTPKEAELIRQIQSAFPHSVENPGAKLHQEKYKEYAEKTGNGMNYFFEEVLPLMHAGIFLPFEDGKFGAGVFKEATFLKEKSKPIWEINQDGLVNIIDTLDAKRALSVEETRKRLKTLMPSRA